MEISIWKFMLWIVAVHGLFLFGAVVILGLGWLIDGNRFRGTGSPTCLEGNKLCACRCGGGADLSGKARELES